MTNQSEGPKTNMKQATSAQVFLIAIIAAAGSFIFGYDIVIMSGAILYLKEEFTLTAGMEGFAMTSAGYGVLAGWFLSFFVADRLGRKRTMIFASILFGVSAIGTAFPETYIGWRALFPSIGQGITKFDMFVDWNIYRFLGGIGGGLAIMVAPVYIAEMAPARKRGALVMMYQLAQVIGAASSNILAWWFAKSAEIDPDFPAWRWMFGSEIIPVILFVIGLSFIPKSPRWLAQKGRYDEARDIFTFIDGPEHAESEMLEVKESLKQESGNLSELFGSGIRMALIVAVGLAAFQQLAGVSTVIFYAPSIFQEAGIALESEALKQTIILVGWNLCCTITALFLIDRLGRRPLLLIGALGMAVGQLLIAASFHFELSPLFLLLAMFVAIGFYIMSLAPVTHVMISEVFPTRLRARGVAMAGIFHSLSGQGTNHMFPVVRDWFESGFGSPAGAFVVFAGICIAAFIFNYSFVPETKKKTLEEIAQFWKSKAKMGNT